MRSNFPLGLTIDVRTLKLESNHVAVSSSESCGILLSHESPSWGRDPAIRKVSRGVTEIVPGKDRKLVSGNPGSMRDISAYVT